MHSLFQILTKIDYKCYRHDLSKKSNENGLFLTLCHLRHTCTFELKDIAARFGLTLQTAGIVITPVLTPCFVIMSVTDLVT